jgi:catechol 2,3-dioxygenase-like lactoylglutathione lyase family enzyme
VNETPPRQRTQFDHVGISVPDLQAAADWYCAALGLQAESSFQVPGTDLSGRFLLHAGSGYRIELLHRPGAKPGLDPGSAYDAVGTLGYGHMCLRVADVQAEFDRLCSCGATPRMQPSPAPRPGGKVSFVADPWGNLIEVIDR